MNDPVYVLRDRYRNNDSFRAMTDQLLSFMVQQRVQPYEVRDAAFIAELMYRERYVDSLIMVMDRTR